MFGLLAYWFDFLDYGRGFVFLVIVAVSSIVRIVRRTRTSSTTTQQFQQFQQPFVAPNPFDASGERPRSTPLPGIFGSDPPPPPPR